MADVAIFLPNLDPGGAERSMVNLASALACRGWEVDLVVADGRGAFRTLVPRDVRVLDLGAGRVLRALPGLVAYLRRQPPRAMVAALDHANVVAVAARGLARAPTRVVVTVHNRLEGARHPRRWADRLLPAAMRAAYARADAVVAVSAAVAEDLARYVGVPRRRVRVLGNPVVGPELQRLAAQPADHPWFEAGGPPVILFVGRLVPEKDLPTLLRAFALLRRERPARLVVVGDGPERPRLATLAEELGVGADIAWLGTRVNPYPYMARARVLVLPSRTEGLPLVLVEALALGTPVVATDCPSGPAEILRGGKLGRLVPVGDAEGLARAIAETMDRPPDAETLRRGVEPFTVDRVLPAYLELMGLDGPPPRAGR